MRGSVRGDWRKPVPYRDEVQDIEEVELLRSCFAGGVEGVITDMSGVFLDPGEKIECCTRTCTPISPK